MIVISAGSSSPNLRAAPVILPLLDFLASVPGLESISAPLKAFISSPHGELLVRKTAHAAEYAVLAWLVARALDPPHGPSQLHRTPSITRVVWVFLLCLAFAAGDEFHQTLVPGRCGQVRDVAIDATGVAIGLLLASRTAHCAGMTP
jgi:VanZ family protein